MKLKHWSTSGEGPRGLFFVRVKRNSRLGLCSKAIGIPAAKKKKIYDAQTFMLKLQQLEFNKS